MTSKPITIEPLGGLGNQLFVYSTGLALSQRVNVPLHADTWNFIDYEWHDFELDSFTNSIELEYQSRSGRTLLDRLLRHRMLDAVRYKAGSRLFIERNLTFDPRVHKLGPGSHLRGYFGSPKYFSEVSQMIRGEVAQIKSPTQWFQETSSLLAQLGTWLGVQVRRGNYTVVPGMGLAGYSYYAAAIRLVDKCVGELPIVVFSDDPTEALEVLGPELQNRLLCLEPPASSRPIESLNLLRQATHLIIANSTFGWWGAWLEDSPDRMVVYPRPWLDYTWHNDRDLIPPGWISVSR